MSMLSESLTIGLLLTLVFGTLFFYIYTRVSYAEKRVGLIENILIDIKMNQEQQPIHVLPPIPPSMNFDNASFVEQTIEISPSPSPPSPPPSDSSSPSFQLVEQTNAPVESNVDELYSNILDEAHSSLDLSENTVPSDSLPKLSVNYESMTKEELIEVAKQKGIRITNRPGREKLLQLIRGTELMTVPEE